MPLRILIAFFSLLIATSGRAQLTPDTLWTRTYGGAGTDVANSAQETREGNLLVAGVSESYGAGEGDMIVWKIDGSGNVTGMFTYGGGLYDEALACDTTGDGGWILAGVTLSFGIGGSDIYVVKSDSLGLPVWERTLGGPWNDAAYSIRSTHEGGAIVVGVKEVQYSVEHMFVAKLNEHGDSEWEHTYTNLGRGRAWCVKEKLGFGYVVGGYAYDGLQACNLLGLDSLGNTAWQRTENWGNKEVRDFILRSDGGFVLAGQEDQAPKIVRLDSSRNTVWTRWLVGWGGVASIVNAYESGSCIAVGSSGYAFKVAKIDSNGGVTWSREFTGDDNSGGQCIIAAMNGYIACGSMYLVSDAHQAFVVRFSRESGNDYVDVIAPSPGVQWTILSRNTIRWQGIGLDFGVHIELNRSYPSGPWETITDSTANDGEYEWFVTDPLSDRCRIRVSAVQDTFSDISDGDFSIVSSQGYLALARSSAPTTNVLNWNAGTVECPSVASEWFRLKNVGSEAIVVFQPLEPVSAEFSCSTACGTFFALAPGEMSACSLQLMFDPLVDGQTDDTLLIQTDAVNAVNGYVRIPLSGVQVSTPATPNVVISPQGEHARLDWNRVTHSVGGCAVDVTRYLVFYSPTSGGPYYFHGFTSDTTYTHVGVITYAPAMFYNVIATTASPALVEQIPEGAVMEEVAERLRR